MSFEVRNAGSATVALSEYEWDADANANPDAIPFALIGDRRYNVFRLRPQNKRLFPAASVGCWAKVSNWPGLGTMRLLVPSGMLGGAIGTFTMLAFVLRRLELTAAFGPQVLHWRRREARDRRNGIRVGYRKRPRFCPPVLKIFFSTGLLESRVPPQLPKTAKSL